MMKRSSGLHQTIFDIVGEAGTTLAGEPRQKVLLHCEPGDWIELRREPGNSHDPNAVLVFWDGHDIGYVPRELALSLAPELDAGRPYKAQVHRIKGGVPDYPSYGVEFSIGWDGEECPACRPLDQKQMQFRRTKIAAAAQKRDDSGAFAADKSKGCVVSLMLIGNLIVVGGGWLLHATT